MELPTSATLFRLSSVRDACGARTLGDGSRIWARIVDVERRVAPSSTPSGYGPIAAGDAAKESAGSMRILVGPTTTIGIGDKVTILGSEMRVSAVHPRWPVVGDLDHIEIVLSPWS